MATDVNQLRVEQIRRILEASGWRIVQVDMQGERVRLIVERPKEG
jgi:hypothetical protein